MQNQVSVTWTPETLRIQAQENGHCEEKAWGESSGKENALLLQPSAALVILTLALPLTLPLSFIWCYPPDPSFGITVFQPDV